MSETTNGHHRSHQQKKVIIIGAGVGGSAAAARLAKNGFQVEVYEKNEFSGGRCSLIHKNGHRWDQGPSLLLMPKLFEEAFADLGENIYDHMEIRKCPINYRVYFHDGKSVELSSDLAALKRQVEAFEGDNEQTLLNFTAWLKETHIHYEHSVRFALKTPFRSIWDLIKIKYLPELFNLHLFESVYRRAKKYFKSEHMIKAFTFQTMYMGMSPYDSPGPYSLLQYTEIAEGIWYPKGGFHKVVEKLEHLARDKFGAKFHYNQPIRKIITDKNDKATGIELEDGTEINADIVVCNADLVYAYNKLLPPTKYAENLATKEHTSSSISFYWGLKEKVDKFSVHNVFLASAYRESFDEIFKKHTLPSQASFYVNVPSRIDSDAAPEGKDTMVVLVPTGHMTNMPGDMDALVARARRQVIDVIEERMGIKDFASYIETEIINDPRTWGEKFNLWNGSILGLTHSVFQVLAFRPNLKSPVFKDLYFVGASTQPGTGVPIVLCGSKLLADQIMLDHGKTSNKANNSLTPMTILLPFFFLILYGLAKIFGLI
ncbi:uncharacterized protein LOC141849728 [Brevipalpus obovatus]|uniref:uncharacterized protein LOC141849728 n=1 Tax=Brevipalpus obovatus TaxID=246614 RepID=UPI003D9E033E